MRYDERGWVKGAGLVEEGEGQVRWGEEGGGGERKREEGEGCSFYCWTESGVVKATQHEMDMLGVISELPIVPVPTDPYEEAYY